MQVCKTGSTCCRSLLRPAGDLAGAYGVLLGCKSEAYLCEAKFILSNLPFCITISATSLGETLEYTSIIFEMLDPVLQPKPFTHPLSLENATTKYHIRQMAREISLYIVAPMQNYSLTMMTENGVDTLC